MVHVSCFLSVSYSRFFLYLNFFFFFFFFQAEDGIRDYKVTGVQTCALPILLSVTASPSLSPTARNKGRAWLKYESAFCGSPK